MIESEPPPISEIALLAELHTQTIGRHPHIVREATSTIDLARDWLDRGAPDGAVVIALRQFDGRGRLDRAWSSPPGGLWLTLILRRHVEPEHAGLLGIILALAAADAVDRVAGTRVMLRWPNDLLLDGRKLGGVLVETRLQGDHIEAALLSLGLNVNFPLSDLPTELHATATTLQEVTGREVPLTALAASFFDDIEIGLSTLPGDPGAALGAWRYRDALHGQEVTLDVAGTTLRGRARGIDRHGRLLLATGWLRRTPVETGEVIAVKKAHQ
jgi:BirA family biotin operon repressor/biotin-[acetyl-CoA-carboxylase] ligase